MVSVTFVLKAVVFFVVVVLSYVGIGIVVAVAESVPVSLGIKLVENGTTETLQDVLTALSAVLVLVFFTGPGLLMLVGHAGAWVKHVVLRVAMPLLVVFVAFVISYTGITAALAIQVAPPRIGTLPVDELAAAGALLLTVPLMASRFGTLVSLSDRISLPALRGRTVNVASVELTQIPVGRLREKEKEVKTKTEVLRFQNFLQTLASLDAATEFSLSFREGRGRILFSAFGTDPPDEIQSRLASICRTSFPEFKVTAAKAHPDPIKAETSRIQIAGVPDLKEDSLEPLVRYFLENGYEGDYRVSIERVRSNLISRRLAARRQRRLAEKSEGQRTESGIAGVQDSHPEKDYAAQLDLEESVKAYERSASEFALRVSVEVSGEKRVAEGAAGVLKGTLSSHRRKTALRTGSSDRSTLLLPVEAVPYVWVPQVALGTEIAPSAEFELPPALKGEIELGTVASQSGVAGHLARMPLDDLRKHVFVTGMTGGGKTTTCFNLLLQLHQLGVPFLVIEPVKNEYRSLLSVVPGLQVFTLGDEKTAPFRLNLFEPPDGVRVQTHLENLAAAWNASFVMYSPTQYVFKEVVEWTYRACGWSLKLNRRGKPIALSDLRHQTELVTGRLGYEPNVTMDIEAALRTRITSLTLGGKGPMFDTLASIPVETLLRRPTVIELRNVPSNEEKAFVAALLLSNIVEYLETRGSSKHLAHLILIEEAHRLLPNLSTAKGDPEGADPRRMMVEQFANMLAELRAYGEGLAIVEQIPTKILPDAIKNTATKIVHRVPAADDRQVLAGAMNMTEEQSAVLTGLKPGEAVLNVEKHPLPIRIVTANAVGKLGIPLGEISDEEVNRQMAEFYMRNPLPKPPPERHEEELLEFVDAEWFAEKFALAYGRWHESGETVPLAVLVTDSARKFARNDEEVAEVSEELLGLAALLYLPFDAADRTRFPRLFIRRVERSGRDGRRA